MLKSFKTIFCLGVLILANFGLSFAQTDDVLSEANKLFQSKQYEAAATAFQKIVGAAQDDSIKAKALYNLGLTYQQLKRHDDAIETFKRIFPTNANDREPGGSIMQIYRNYRSSAQWQIGVSYFAKNDFARALDAFRTARTKYLYRSGCGTCDELARYKQTLTEAICLERLGNYDEAVNLYWRIFDPRLVELYEANGQLANLKAIVSRYDEAQIAENQQKYRWTREYASQYLPTRHLTETIKLFDREKNKDWKLLLESLSQYRYRDDNNRRDVAALILARNAAETVPFITGALRNPTEKTPVYTLYEALGKIQSPEAVAFLKEKAETEKNWQMIALAVQALGFAGELGENALKQLEADAKGNLKLALDRRKKGELTIDFQNGENQITFPAVKTNLKLPTEFKSDSAAAGQTARS